MAKKRRKQTRKQQLTLMDTKGSGTITYSDGKGGVFAAKQTVRMRTDKGGAYWQAHLGGIWVEPVWAIEGDAKRSGNSWARRIGYKAVWE